MGELPGLAGASVGTAPSLTPDLQLFPYPEPLAPVGVGTGLQEPGSPGIPLTELRPRRGGQAGGEPPNVWR